MDKFSCKYLNRNDDIVKKFLFKLAGYKNSCVSSFCSFAIFGVKCNVICKCNIQ